MTIESWIAYVIALSLLGLSPGPAWAAVITTGIARGFPRAGAMALGIALGDVVFLLFAVFGLAVLAQALGNLFIIVKLLGAAYLIWLGISLWRNPPKVDLAAAPQGGRLGPFLGGFALTLGNPKVIAFYLGFLPAFMDLQALTGGQLLLVAATTFVVIAGFLAGYAALAARSRRFFAEGKQGAFARRLLGRVLGTTLIGTGVAVATR